MSYNLGNRYQFIRYGMKYKVLMEHLLKRLDLLNARKIPYLFTPYGFDCEKPKTSFDQIVKKKMNNLAKRFLALMIEADPNGKLYQSIIDKNLMKLLPMGIDMK